MIHQVILRYVVEQHSLRASHVKPLTVLAKTCEKFGTTGLTFLTLMELNIGE